MTRPALVLLLVTLAAPHGAAESLNPITRVVQLMEGLTKKIEEDGKAEEDLFEKYVCWYKTVVSTKKASNSQAGDRIDALASYIDDVKGGRLEFTSERKDLEAEVARLSADIESQKEMRKKDAEDYKAAKEEMEMAIASLEKAVEVLSGEGSAAAFASIGFDVRRVVDLGKNSLSKQDAKILEQALDGGLQTPNWDKLNLKASFNKKYATNKSNKISEI